jgi:hypothetical protein
MPEGVGLTSSEPLAEVQRALLVVLVLHAPHPEAGGLLGLRKLREHYMSSWDNPTQGCGLFFILTWLRTCCRFRFPGPDAG